MQSLITLLFLQSAAALALAPSSTPAQAASPAVVTDKPVSAPMTRETWRDMSATEKLQYADATIQGLRRNTMLAQCEGLTPKALVAELDKGDWEGNVLMVGVATAAYGICL